MSDLKRIENSIQKTYRKEIWAKFMKAITIYDLIQPGDKIAVCISGGKDSMLLAKCFDILSRFTTTPFEVKYLVMDPGYNEANIELIKSNAKKLGLDITIFDSTIFEYVETQEKNPCYLCARMRRGYLYRFAKELGCNKIALGHHFDDAIETTMMNMFYAGEIKTMMPKLKATNFEGMELIRPLYLVKEEDIIRWRNYNELQFLDCACRFTSDLKHKPEKTSSKRKEIKTFIKEYKKINPFIDNNIFRSMSNVNLDKVLEYYDDSERVNFLDTYNERKTNNE